MKKELVERLAKERKNKRALDELNALERKVKAQVQPDPKILAMIDEARKELLA